MASVVCERFIINEYISVERLTQNTSVATTTEYVNSDLTELVKVHKVIKTEKTPNFAFSEFAQNVEYVEKPAIHHSIF